MLIERVEAGASGIAKIAAGGSSFFVRLDYVVELGLDPSTLCAGQELDSLAESILAQAAEAGRAEQKALGLLARAEQSEARLRLKLLERGFSERAVSLVLAYLGSKNLLSDARFAEAWLRNRVSRKAEGPRALMVGLRARGIDETTARKALDAVLDPESRRDLLAIRLRAVMKRGGGKRESLIAELRGDGFRGEEIRACLDSLDGEI